jgi:RNA polymerase sigma-70 factor, ECF subfamily
LEVDQELDAFLAGEEKRAYHMAELSTRSREEALDIIQDAMIKFVEKYANKEKTAWRPLFYRVVNSRIMDWHRRRQVRCVVTHLFGDDGPDAFVSSRPDPPRDLTNVSAMKALEYALGNLPLRQRQAVLHRLWDGMNTQETAIAMGISAGSVKTHYSRGLKSLQQRLGDHWP